MSQLLGLVSFKLLSYRSHGLFSNVKLTGTLNAILIAKLATFIHEAEGVEAAYNYSFIEHLCLVLGRSSGPQT